MDGVGAADVLDGHVRQSHGADLACLAELGHRSHRLFDGRLVASVVQVVQVDRVGLQPSEAAFDR
jgi:hypothetical protein